MEYRENFNDQELDTILNSGKLTLLDFWGSNCPGCEALEVQLQKALREYDGKINLLKVNIAQHPQLGSRFFVRSLPTLLFIKNSVVKKQLMGAVPASIIASSIRECL